MTKLFVSAVTDEFKEDRIKFATERFAKAGKTIHQEALRNRGTTLSNLYDYLIESDEVLAFVGSKAGYPVLMSQVNELRRRLQKPFKFFNSYTNFMREKKAVLYAGKGEMRRLAVSYTQFEILIALELGREFEYIRLNEKKGDSINPSDPKPTCRQDLFCKWLESRAKHRAWTPESIGNPVPDAPLKHPSNIKAFWNRVDAYRLDEARRLVDSDTWTKDSRKILNETDRESFIRPEPGETHFDNLSNEELIVDRPKVARSIRASSARKPHTVLIADAAYGKTYFMESLRRQLKDRVIAFYQFDLGHTTRSKPTLFANSITAQCARWLSRKTRGYDIVVPNGRLREELLKRETRDDSTIIQELTMALQKAPRPEKEYAPAYLLLDALDEIDEKQHDSVSLLIEELSENLPPWIRIVASSQPGVLEGPLRESLQNIRWRIVEKRTQRDKLTGKFMDSEAREEHIETMREVCAQRVDEYLSTASTKVRDKAKEALMAKAGDNFLYLRYLLLDIKRHQGEDIAATWFRRLPSRLEKYYTQRFEHWFRKRPDANVRNILKIMVVAREPLSIRSIAAIAKVSAKEVQDILGRMATFLEGMPRERGLDTPCEFHHSSTMREWLTSGDAANFRVTEVAGQTALAVYSVPFLQGIASRKRGAKVHDILHDYLVKHGMYHLLEAARLSDIRRRGKFVVQAVSILAHLHRQSHWTDVHELVAGVLNEYNRKLFDLLAMIGIVPYDLNRIVVEDLVKLIEEGCNEIPRLYPPMRVVVEHHLSRLGEFAPRIIESDQLLSRYSLARAIADSFHESHDTRHRTDLVLLAIRWFRDSRRSSDLREAGCYALKCLISQGEPRGIRELEEFIPVFTEECATSPNYNLRMAYSEMLIELAISGRRLQDAGNQQSKRNPDLDTFVPHVEFWSPRWPYHAIDLCELLGTLESKSVKRGPGVAVKKHRDTPVGRFAAAVRKQVTSIGKRITTVKSELTEMRRDKAFKDQSLQNCLTWENYCRTELILRLLGKSKDALGHDLRKYCREHEDQEKYEARLERYLRQFALHPVWEVTEAAASVASDLRETLRVEIDNVLRKWSNETRYWQLRYAAVDAAYNSRHLDRGKSQELFANFVRRHCGATANSHGKPFTETNRRVIYISAEDVFLAFEEAAKKAEDTPGGEAKRFAGKKKDEQTYSPLEDPKKVLESFENEFKWWLEHADDCATLDELFQFTDTVMNEERNAKAEKREVRQSVIQCQESLRRMLNPRNPNAISKYLRCSYKGNWWNNDRDDWLEKMDDLRVEVLKAEKKHLLTNTTAPSSRR